MKLLSCLHSTLYENKVKLTWTLLPVDDVIMRDSTYVAACSGGQQPTAVAVSRVVVNGNTRRL